MMYNQKGFSLFELIVVVGIIAAVTGILLPVYFSMKPTIRVNGAARQIQGDFMWARMRAVSENNNYVITFGSAGPDLSNDTYYIYDDDNGDFNDPAVPDANELVKTVVISGEYEGVGYGFVPGMDDTSGGTLNAGDPPVTFQPASNISWFKFKPNGRSNKNGSIYLILDEDQTNSRKDRSRAITVILQTGRIKIYDYNAINDKWE
jgi:prepilin-type N-terminal cleavage/methylation domain-containing protein